jgi:hypothetical protein
MEGVHHWLQLISLPFYIIVLQIGEEHGPFNELELLKNKPGMYKTILSGNLRINSK